MATPPSNRCKSDRGYALYLSTVTVDKTSHIRCNRDAHSVGIAVPSCTYLETSMKRQYIKAFNALKSLGVPVYVRDDMEGRFQISAEDPESYRWVNFYDGHVYPDWIFGVHPKICAVLDKCGLHAEWINGGEVGVYPS